METIKQTRTLKYTYSQEETLGLSVDLANANNALVALENEKKTFTSQIGAQINEQKERISGLSQKVALGYEFREVECRVDFQTPDPGHKTVTRMDTGECWVETMLSSDYNLFNQPDPESGEEENGED